MIKIAEYKGFPIYYEAGMKRFSSEVDESEISAPTQDAVEALIDKMLKSRGIFPIKVIHIAEYRITYGRLTSYNPSTKRGWFVSEGGERGNPWDLDSYHLDTECNRRIVGEIQTKITMQEEISKEISMLRKQLEKPVKEFLAEAFKRDEGKG